MSFFVTSKGGLTTAGYIAVGVAIFLLLVIIAAIGNHRRKISAKVLAFSAAAIALAFITSFITIFHAPMGGSITLFSMLFVTLVGYWYGPAVGIMAGVAYGLLQLIQDPYILSLPQMLFDYVFAFGALGLSGFFSNAKHGLVKGYIVAIFGRWVFAFLSGVIFFGQSAPKAMGPILYSAAYNGFYIGIEGAVTIVILMIPAVSKALQQVRQQARA